MRTDRKQNNARKDRQQQKKAYSMHLSLHLYSTLFINTNNSNDYINQSLLVYTINNIIIMLESLTIFTTGGLILYQYIASPSLLYQKSLASTSTTQTKQDVSSTSLSLVMPTNTTSSQDNDTNNTTNNDTTTIIEPSVVAFHHDILSRIFIGKILSNPTHNKYYYGKHTKHPSSSSNASASNTTNNKGHNVNHYLEHGVTYVWILEPIYERFYIVLIYPDIVYDGPRFYLKQWSIDLIYDTLNEYAIYYQSSYIRHLIKEKQDQQNQKQDNQQKSKKNDEVMLETFVRPDPMLFHTTFYVILMSSKTKNQRNSHDDSDSSDPTMTTNIDSLTRTIANSDITSTTRLPQHLMMNGETDENENNENDIHRQITSLSQPSNNTSTTKINNNIVKTNLTNNKKKKGNTKEKRTWNDGNAKITDKAMAELDKSSAPSNAFDSYQNALYEARLAYLPNDHEHDNEENKLTNNNALVATQQNTSYITQAFQYMKFWDYTKTITITDLEIPCHHLYNNLIHQNVNSTIANEMISIIKNSLLNKQLKTFYYTIDIAIQQALYQSIQNILYYDQSFNFTQSILLKKQKQQQYMSSSQNSYFTSSSSKKQQEKLNYCPYVIIVMGINGIGKTTTIAKLAYKIQNVLQLQPMLVACDTFRSGAVEQLKIHADCLNIPFYTQGYSKDPANVASSAIEFATNWNTNIANSNATMNTNTSTNNTTTNTTSNQKMIDVLLIDTAGRMQNNIPLMNSLNKLIIDNIINIDCCLFICEALVGHDAINQYTMFNKACSTNITNKSNGNNGNGGINGIIVTKYDTVDTKIGTILSLSYETSKPIIFIGTGQKYHHLNEINIDHITSQLLSNSNSTNSSSNSTE